MTKVITGGNKFPFLPDKKIEEKAKVFLQDYVLKYKVELKPPIDIINILDCMSDCYVEAGDLQGEHGEGTLGKIDASTESPIIYFDHSIDPEINPRNKGRCNFTIAHEAGHLCLHVPILRQEEADSLLPYTDECIEHKKIICRSFKKSNRPLIEKQADKFASYVLMPADLVFAQWEEIYGSPGHPVYVEEHYLKNEQYTKSTPKSRIVPCKQAQQLAERFEVSNEAMHYRLKELNLITTSKQLFLF